MDTTNCTGNATAWNVCYYNTTSAFFSNTQFGVYRPLPGSTNYTLVPGSLSSYYVIRGSSIYTCTKYPIAQQFVVQPGDVIFACLQQNLQLGVIGNVSAYPGYSVLRADATASSISSCLSVVTNLINVAVGYSTLTGLALHVKLDINKCALNNGGCEQTCTNTSSGNTCNCFAGYQLDSNGMACNALQTSTVITATATETSSGSSTTDTTAPSTTAANTSVTYTGALNPSSASSPDHTLPESTINVDITTAAILTSWNVMRTSSAVAVMVPSFSRDFVTPTSTSTFNTVVSSERLPASTIAAIVTVLVIVAGVTVAVFGTVIICRKKLNKKYLVLGHSNASDAQSSLYKSVDLNNPMYTMDKTPNIQEFRSQYENLDAGSCVSLYACIDAEDNQNDLGLSDKESPYAVPPSHEDELYRQVERQHIKKINRQEIELAEEIGHGQFGGVHTAIWSSSEGSIEVAVKVMNMSAYQWDEKIRFLQEAVIMAQFMHSNVIQLYGIVTEGNPTMLVIELAHNKDLRTYLSLLRSSLSQMVQSDVSDQLLSCSQQVALGMQYLSTKAFVHRDLAARNVFVTRELVCKIGDFGLSRNLDNENYYVSHGGAIPVKWTAPEAVHYKKYSTASDVWSYGCLLYEIWSVGRKPFEGRSNTEVIENVDAGYRLPPPPGCPLHIYQIMIQCWNPEPYSRPKFREIHLSLTQNEAHVFMIPNEALQSHPQAQFLGAPLEAGEKMYLALQKTYLRT
eukprot:Em0011g683a